MCRFLRLSAISLALILTVSLLGCGSKELSTKEKQTSSPENATKSVAVKDHSTVKVTAEKPIKKNVSASQQESRNSKTPAVSGNTSNTKRKPAAKPAQTAPPKKSSVAKTIVKPKTATSTVKSAASHPAGTTPSKTAPVAQQKQEVHTVTFSLVGPKDKGTIIGAKKVEFKEGNTILDILLKVAGKSNVDYSGSGAMAYIEGIDNIYEFDYGPKSGWVIKLNGKSLSKSSGVIKVNDGDRIECYYTQ